ncbi:hypothetical protein [Methanolobus sp.]|uniref:hypothetical protein n=1 Tax=Methanolobus sp. TaxID=1874737 RepID=UPI0025EAA4C9|nr:hypothetical protein [Methanolobus sp.]
MTDDTCICCGQSLHTQGKPLCHYCLYRSEIGTAKYLMFKAMLSNGNEFFTINEILDMTNERRRSLGLSEVKYHAIQTILRRYSKFYNDRKIKGSGYLLLVQPDKKGNNGRPKLKFKLSARLVKRFKKYDNRWNSGLPVNIRNKNGGKFKMTMDYKSRSNSIRMRLKTGIIQPYEHMIYLSKINLIA